MYIRRRGSNLLRGVNVNAPLANGVRPDPAAGHRHRDPVGRRDRSWMRSASTSTTCGRSSGCSWPRTTRFGRSLDEADSAFSLPADNYDLAGRARARARLPAAPVHEHGEPAAEGALPPRHVAARACRRCPTTSRPDATTTATRSATIGRPASTRNSGRGRAQVDLGLRLSWGIGVRRSGGAAGWAADSHRARRQRRSAVRDAGGLDGQNKRYTRRALRAGVQHAEPHERR